jgi:hypothetical protein
LYYGYIEYQLRSDLITNMTRFFNNLFDANSILDSFYPVIYFGRVIGIFPYTIDRKSQTSSVNMFYLIWGILFESSFLILLFKMTGPERRALRVFASGNMMKLADSVRRYLGGPVGLLVFVTIFFKPGLYYDILDLLMETDTIFAALGYKKNYRKIKTIILLLVMLSILLPSFYLIICVIFFLVWNFHMPFTFLYCLYIPGLMFSGLTLVFNCLVYLIYKNVRLHNKILNELSEERTAFGRSRLFLDNRKENIDRIKSTIEHLWNIFDTICDTCDIINDFYAPKLVLFLLGSFLAIIFSEYIAFASGIQVYKGNQLYIPILLISLHQCVQYSNIMTTLILICNKCENEVKMRNI